MCLSNRLGQTYRGIQVIFICLQMLYRYYFDPIVHFRNYLMFIISIRFSWNWRGQFCLIRFFLKLIVFVFMFVLLWRYMGIILHFSLIKWHTTQTSQFNYEKKSLLYKYIALIWLKPSNILPKFGMFLTCVFVCTRSLLIFLYVPASSGRL